jgi:hypothetical protein
MTQTQARPPLTQAVQQLSNIPAAALLADQIQDFTDDGDLSADSDFASCDASGGAFTLTLPGGGSVYVGKPYTVKEFEGTNGVTIAADGSGTIDGAATLALAAGEAVTLIPLSVDDANDVTWVISGQTLTAGGDPTAIHDNVAGEIAAIALKATPVNGDLLVIEDSAAANAKKRVTAGTLPFFNRSTAGQIAALGAKATPVAADTLVINDSAAADAVNKVTIGSLPVAQAQVAQVISQPAADAAFEISATTGGVQLTVTGAGNEAITTNVNCFAGQRVNLFAVAVAGGGSYTLVLDVGTLTLNATGEGAVVMRNAGNTAWVCVGLSGATIV